MVQEASQSSVVAAEGDAQPQDAKPAHDRGPMENTTSQSLTKHADASGQAPAPGDERPTATDIEPHPAVKPALQSPSHDQPSQPDPSQEPGVSPSAPGPTRAGPTSEAQPPAHAEDVPISAGAADKHTPMEVDTTATNPVATEAEPTHTTYATTNEQQRLQGPEADVTPGAAAPADDQEPSTARAHSEKQQHPTPPTRAGGKGGNRRQQASADGPSEGQDAAAGGAATAGGRAKRANTRAAAAAAGKRSSVQGKPSSPDREQMSDATDEAPVTAVRRSGRKTSGVATTVAAKGQGGGSEADGGDGADTDGEPGHVDDKAGEEAGRGGRGKGGAAAPGGKGGARARARFGSGARLRKSATEDAAEAKAAGSPDAKPVGEQISQAGEAVAAVPGTAEPPAGGAAKAGEDVETAQAPPSSQVPAQRSKRQRSDALPAGSPSPGVHAGGAVAAAASTMTVSVSDLDGDEGPAGMPRRAAKRQTTMTAAAATTAGTGQQNKAAGTAAAAAAAAPGGAAPTPGRPAAATNAAIATPATATVAGGSYDSESDISERISTALSKLETARRQETEAVAELHRCVQALYDRPYNFNAFLNAGLGPLLKRGSKAAAAKPEGGAGEGGGGAAGAGAGTGAGGTGPSIASVAADMNNMITAIKVMGKRNVTKTKEPIRTHLQQLNIVVSPPHVSTAPQPPAAPALVPLARALSTQPPAVPAPPSAPAAAAPPVSAPQPIVVSAFEPTGEPLRDKAVALLAAALQRSLPLHPLDAALALEAQLMATHGEQQQLGGGVGVVPGDAYVARLRWLCEVLAPEGGSGGSEVARLVVEGRVRAEELVGWEGGGQAAGSGQGPQK